MDAKQILITIIVGVALVFIFSKFGSQKVKKTNVRFITAIGLMAALVFIFSKISLPIPLAVGSTPARIHFGNIFCLLSGLILGPIGGGLSAGLGSALYDFTEPAYAASAPFTFVFKFIMAYVCGKIAYSANKDGRHVPANVIAGVLGIVAYMVLYLSKSFVTDVYFKQLEMPVAMVNMATRAVSSTVNGIIAVLISMPLGTAIRTGLEQSNLFDNIKYQGSKR